MNNKVLILLDHRPGNNNQSLALIQELKLNHIEISVKYNFLAKLPNLFLNPSFITIDKDSKNQILNHITKFKPNIIISAGRRLSIIALAIKKILKNQPKIIQIMNPKKNLSLFDLVILPYHDKKIDQYSNIIYINGALNYINKNEIMQKNEQYLQKYSSDNKGIISLLIGGKSKNFDIDIETISKVMSKIDIIAKKTNYKIFILNSRRTSNKINKYIKNNLKDNHSFIDYNSNINNNPSFKAVLAISNLFIVSPDSISMISECSGTNKPTYVFNCKKKTSQKHQNFVKYMIENNFLKEFNINDNYLKEFTPKKFNETKRISLIIKKLFL